MNLLRQSLTKLAVIWALAIVFLGLTVTTDNFFSVMNLRNILDQQAFVLIIAGFATIVIISGGFDVSLGAIYILSPIVALKVENATGSILYMVLAGAAVGITAGIINGLIIAYAKINSFITTLALWIQTGFLFLPPLLHFPKQSQSCVVHLRDFHCHAHNGSPKNLLLPSSRILLSSLWIQD